MNDQATVKILMAVTEDWYFWSHRKPLALALQASGCEFIIATRFNRLGEAIEDAGFACVALPFERSLRHPLKDLSAAWGIWGTVRAKQPDIVHLVSLKPIALSFLAAVFNRQTQFVAAITGMGYLFTRDRQNPSLIQTALIKLLRWLLARKNYWVIVQNPDDERLMVELGLGEAARRILIPGVGVDVGEYKPSTSDKDRVVTVILPARLIRDKGIEEFVVAAGQLKRRFPNARFVLVGDEDPDNPAAISPTEVSAWVESGALEWWGYQDDMAIIYAQAAIVCLPSYREGLPKVLLEASASGLPLVATDVPGCREICRDGENGFLVAPRNVEGLVDALAMLLADEVLRTQFGAAGRAIAEREYALEVIAEQTRQFYHTVALATERV